MAPSTPPAPATPQVFLRLDTGTHTDAVLQLIASPDGRRLISAGDSTVRVWDARSHALLQVLRGRVPGRAQEVFGAGRVRRMALSPADGRSLVVLRQWIATPDDPGPGPGQRATELQVYNTETGRLQTRCLLDGELTDLDFSPDGRWLALVGWGATLSVHAAAALLRAGFARLPVPQFSSRLPQLPEGVPLKAALRFVPTHRPGSAPYTLLLAVRQARVAGGLGTLHWLHWGPASGLQPLRQEATGADITLASLSVNADWAVVGDADSPGPGLRVQGRQTPGRLLCHRHDGYTRLALATEAPPATTAFAPTGSRLLVGLSAPPHWPPGQATLPVQAYAASCLGFTPRSTYHGHDDSVQALAFLADDLAVSAGGDSQALHLWDSGAQLGQPLAQIRGRGRTVFQAWVNRHQQLLFSTVPARLMAGQRLGRLHSFCLNSLQLGSTELHPLLQRRGPPGRWQVLDTTANAQLVPLRWRPTGRDDELDLPPDLTVFVGSDDEWVIWTRSGYYAASAQGARRMGYQLNRGVQRPALFLAADRFEALHRPDLVRAVLAHGSEALARAAGVPIEPLDVAERLPPVIELLSVTRSSAGDALRLRFAVQPLAPGGAATSVWVMRNDRCVWAAPAAAAGQALRQRRFDQEVLLGPGPNTISLRARNRAGRAEPVVLTVDGPPHGPAAGPVDQQAPGQLFLLSVGVSRIAAADTPRARQFDLKPLHCAHCDAIAVHNALGCGVFSDEWLPTRALRNRAFEAVQATLLVEQQATKAAICEALRALIAQMQARQRAPGAERDVLLLFLAGHGVQVVGEPHLYFANHDIDIDREETGLTMQEIGELLAQVPAEVVVMVDTCHSALSGSGVARGFGPDELARRLQGVNERSMLVLSAALADEKAFEGQDHGVFTAALLATLRTRRYLSADADGRGHSLQLAGLMHGLLSEAPRITERLGKPPQTPVFQSFGQVLPLALYRP